MSKHPPPPHDFFPIPYTTMPHISKDFLRIGQNKHRKPSGRTSWGQCKSVLGKKKVQYMCANMFTLESYSMGICLLRRNTSSNGLFSSKFYRNTEGYNQETFSWKIHINPPKRNHWKVTSLDVLSMETRSDRPSPPSTKHHKRTISVLIIPLPQAREKTRCKSQKAGFLSKQQESSLLL